MSTIKCRQSLVFVLLTLVWYPCNVVAFVGKSPRASPRLSRLNSGPFQKITNPSEYTKVVDNIMFSQGLTRDEAEKEYNAYLDNPNNYALEKGEKYYKALGYKSLMDGVIGEADKEGKGDEVRARIKKFKDYSQLKGLITIGCFIALGFYFKITHPYIPPSQF